jgi:uncharacterized membrane protein YoaK (UPF0700 family)
MALAQGNFIMGFHLFLLIIAFVLGSFISAALVGGSSFRIDRSYGLVLLLESSALALGYLFEVSETFDSRSPREKLRLFALAENDTDAQ